MSRIIIIVKSSHQQLERLTNRTGRSGNFCQNSLENRSYIDRIIFYRTNCISVSGGSVKDRVVQLGFLYGQFQKQVVYLIFDFLYSNFRSVNFIYNNNWLKSVPHRLLQNIPCLWHRPIDRVDQKNTPVCHIHNPFHFPTKIRMSWGVNNIYLRFFVGNRNVLGKNSDPFLSLQRITIRDQNPRIFSFSKSIALL